jgi:hypothetical protein
VHAHLARLVLAVGLALLAPACGLAGGGDDRRVSEQAQTDQSGVSIALPDLGPAPAIEGDVWLNSQGSPDMQGRVVLLEMWTFG